MTKCFKSVISLFMVLIMCFQVVSASVLAIDVDENTNETSPAQVTSNTAPEGFVPQNRYVDSESSLRALHGGVTTDKVFDFVKTIHAEVNVPFVFVTYANVVFSYGSERFISTCRTVGVDGLMVQDLPFEERYEFLNECHAYHVELIHQITTSSEDRIEMIAKGAEGMVCVSVMANDGEDYPHMCGRLAHVTERIKACTDVPCIICYNCAQPHAAKMMADISDGLLIATQSVEALATLGEKAPAKIGADIAVVRKAID